MKASYRWLKELLPGLTASPRDLADKLTGSGLEVEAMSEYGAATENVVVARVTGVRPHPTKSGLRLVTVDRGGGTQEVVCGAPNVPDPGGLVVLAPLGTHLPAKGLTIGKRAIGGVESEGMLCSEDELGLGDDHDGIIVLPSGDPGTPLVKAVPSSRDTVLEIGLTPNRPDGLGHIGLAREIAALYAVPFSWPAAGELGRVADVACKDLVTIAVEDAERCPHYGAAAAIDLKIGPSPDWARHRLQALGVRSISNVVDITNLVMLEYGHPMHAFDLDRVHDARIVVRRAKEGERLKTLDGVERVLVADDLVICDGSGPDGLAGVMGGASSEIHASTKRVLFECAWFEPRGVRRTARRHGMHTEASHRFERGVDPGDIARVLDRAVALTVGLAGAAAARGRLHVQGARVAPEPAPPERRTVVLRARRVGDLLGVEIPWTESLSILGRLGCGIVAKDDAQATVLAPTHRPDISREADLIEEIIRVHGIDRVPAELPAIRASRDVGGREELAARARAAAVSLGLSEAITYGFTSRETITALKAPKASVVLKNPLGEHTGVMRTSLLPGLLEAVKNARRHGERDVREFTIGPVFLPDGPEGLPREELRIAVVLAGDRPAWLTKPSPLDAWDAKGHAAELASRLAGGSVRVTPAARAEAPPHLHPRGAGFVSLENGTSLGSFGPLHPDVVDDLALDGEVLAIELSLEPFVAGIALPRYRAIPRFPAATRDVAFIVKDGVPAGDVERAVRDAAGPLAEEVRIFDRFVGGQVPSGHANLAFHIVYRAPDRTLTDVEVDAAHANIAKTIGDRFGATLRQ
jgi:phenylalanyl-tRNA synthetase beta chain